jgi:hypothetical protein
VSPVKYKLRFYIPEDDIVHSLRRENLKSYRGDESRFENGVDIKLRKRGGRGLRRYGGRHRTKRNRMRRSG